MNTLIQILFITLFVEVVLLVVVVFKNSKVRQEVEKKNYCEEADFLLSMD